MHFSPTFFPPNPSLQPQQLNERGGSLSVGGSLRVTSLSILARHHFSSKLQRMSVVARPSNSGNSQVGPSPTHTTFWRNTAVSGGILPKAGPSNDGLYSTLSAHPHAACVDVWQALVLVKGSPEIVATLLGEGRMPHRYHESAAHLAKEGMRVLALAYKVLGLTIPLPPFIAYLGSSGLDAA